MNNYTDVPVYYWYLTREHILEYNKMYYYKGITYVGFNDEAEYEVIEKYNLVFVGVGDMTMIGGELNENNRSEEVPK